MEKLVGSSFEKHITREKVEVGQPVLRHKFGPLALKILRKNNRNFILLIPCIMIHYNFVNTKKCKILKSMYSSCYMFWHRRLPQGAYTKIL